VSALIAAPRAGVYNMLESEYRAAPAVANSDLKHIRRSPAHYWAARLDPDREPEKDTPSRIAGRALHCCILEPHTFAEKFVFVPEDAPKDLRHLRDAKNKGDSTIASIQFWDAFEASVAGRCIIDRATTVIVQHAAERIRNHPELIGYLQQGTAEESIFATDPVTGEPVKIRTDWRTELAGMRVIIDLKSTEDARPDPFSRIAYSYGYFAGAAYYCDVHEWAGLGKVDLYLLAAFERDSPNAVKIYEVRDEELQRGRLQYRAALNLFHHCRTNDEWPAYDTAIEPLLFPSWAKD
jgi:exodeoxyribonuclease VIII